MGNIHGIIIGFPIGAIIGIPICIPIGAIIGIPIALDRLACGDEITLGQPAAI